VVTQFFIHGTKHLLTTPDALFSDHDVATAADDGIIIFFFTNAALSEKQQDWPAHVHRFTPGDLDTLG